nr:hypothetical protein [uncultured bacterium]
MKKLLSVLIVSAMIMNIIAGCAVAPAAGATSAAEPAATAAEDVAEAAEPAAEAAPEETEAVWEGDITDINLLLYDLRGVADNAQPILDAMNAITEKSIGVRIHVSWAGAGDYGSQLGLQIASGNQLDVVSIIPRDPGSFTSMIANGQLMDITDEIQEYAPEAYELTKDYISAMTVNGGIYGIPCYRNYGSAQYFIMRQDILEDLGLMDKAQNLTTWTEVKEIFEAVKENTDVSPYGMSAQVMLQGSIIYNNDTIADQIHYDNLGDKMHVIYCDQDGNVSLLVENEEFRKQQDMIKGWYDAGLVYKDSAVSTDHPDTIMKSGVLFSTIQGSEMGVETAKEEATGYKVYCYELGKSMLMSSNVTNFGLGIPVTAQEPEAAIRWINALYMDPVLENLLIWGIEGEDYVLNDGVASFPEGVTAENVAYHSADFMYGNYFNAYPWQGTSATFRQDAYNYLKSVDISPFLGFTANQSDINNVVTAVYSVVEEFRSSVFCGQFDDEKYNNYIAKLKTAGADEMVQVYQSQLDEWKANN